MKRKLILMAAIFISGLQANAIDLALYDLELKSTDFESTGLESMTIALGTLATMPISEDESWVARARLGLETFDADGSKDPSDQVLVDLFGGYRLSFLTSLNYLTPFAEVLGGLSLNGSLSPNQSNLSLNPAAETTELAFLGNIGARARLSPEIFIDVYFPLFYSSLYAKRSYETTAASGTIDVDDETLGFDLNTISYFHQAYLAVGYSF